MRPRPLVLAVCALLLAGCSATDGPPPAPKGMTATPDAGPTRAPADNRAVQAATEAVKQYVRTAEELASWARPNIEDLRTVATGKFLDRELARISRDLSQGYRMIGEGAQSRVIRTELLQVRPTRRPSQIRLAICLDSTGTTRLGPAGERERGGTASHEFLVVRTARGWSVAGDKHIPPRSRRACCRDPEGASPHRFGSP